jgi:tripartite motif-containing protein 9/67
MNDNLTANKRVEVEYETVLGTIEINSGMHYWEIKIDKFVELDDIIIGVSQKGMDL